MKSKTIVTGTGSLVAAIMLAGCSALLPGPMTGTKPEPSPDAAIQALQQEGCGVAEDIVIPSGPEDLEGVSLAAEREKIGASDRLSIAEARETGHLIGVPDSVAGRERRGIVGDDRRVLAYFTNGTFDLDMSRADYFRSGGFIVTQDVPGPGSLADVVKEDVGDRAVRFKVGPHEGAMVRSDPVAVGVRPYLLVWSDGTSTWIVSGEPSSPDAILNFARSLVCD